MQLIEFLIALIIVLTVVFLIVRSRQRVSEASQYTFGSLLRSRYTIGWAEGVGEIKEGFMDLGLYPDEQNVPLKHMFQVIYKDGEWRCAYTPTFVAADPLTWNSALYIVLDSFSSRDAARQFCEQAIRTIDTIVDKHGLAEYFAMTGVVPDDGIQLRLTQDILTTLGKNRAFK